MVADPVHAIPLMPPLESGDILSRAEFHRRYQASPQIKRAELIEGVVYVASPVNPEFHAEPHADIMTWLGMYRVLHPGVRVGDNATVGLDWDNEVQPDAYLRKVDGGSSTLDDAGWAEGPPELVVEVAASSSSTDLHQKLHVYRRNAVQEYVVWRVYDRAIDWFELHDGVYERIPPADDDGIIESRVFPGLRLRPDSMISGDLAAVVAELR